MRIAPLIILAASAAADRKHSDDLSVKSPKDPDTQLTHNEIKSKKKKDRLEKKKEREEGAALKIKDPMAGLTKEIEDLAKLEDALAGKTVAPDPKPSMENALIESSIDSPSVPSDNAVTLEQVEDVTESDETIEEPAKDCTKEMCQYELASDYLLEYKVNVPENTTLEACDGCSLSVILTYEGTAWLGFAMSTNGEMIGSEAVIGHPLMEGTEPGKYYLGGKYDGGIQPMEDEKQTLINASIRFENGQSILQFEKLMQEEGEIEISTGLNTFLWAHGEDNSMSTYHGNNRSPFQLNLLGVGESEAAAVGPLTTGAPISVSDEEELSVTGEEAQALPPCPPAYDPSHEYTAGDKVEVGSFIWECREFPYDMYCNVPEFHPSLTEENPNAEDLWLEAWSKSLGSCVKPPGSPTSTPTAKNSAVPTVKTFKQATLSPSDVVLTAFPTQSPINNSIETDAADLPYPIPELRFVEWKELGMHEKESVEALGYTKYSWNNLEVSDLEESSFKDLSASQQALTLSLGFDEDTWDCFASHYHGYYWSELEAANVDQYFTTLGWTKHSWDKKGKAPESDDRNWEELTEEEQLAATKLCYTENAWDWVPLPSW